MHDSAQLALTTEHFLFFSQDVKDRFNYKAEVESSKKKKEDK